ncbi:MAG: hypothetical protein AAF577_04210 [Pseudomonadota bacterium]
MTKKPILTALVASTLIAGPALAHDPFRTPALDQVTRVIVQTGLGFLRSFIDLTYDAISVDARSGAVTISGLTLQPELPWDAAGACRVSIDRLTLADAGDLVRLDGTASLSGVTVPADCLEPEPAGMIASFGFNEIVADSVGITASYDAPSAGMSLLVEASVADAVALTVSADFDYLAPRAGGGGNFDDPEAVVEDAIPSAVLGAAEVVIENRGLFETLRPMLEAQMGDLQAIPALAQAGALQAFGEGGTRDVTFAERAFADALAEALTAFIEEPTLLVLASDPEPGVRLTEAMFESPASIIGALQPTIGNRPLARGAILDPSLITAAMKAPDTLSPEDRRSLGIALVTGAGAPRDPALGIQMLEPLALEGDAAAAEAMALALSADGRIDDAYAAALAALAAGNTAVIGLADRLEGALPLDTVLNVQASAGFDEALRADILAAVTTGDVSALRRFAEAHDTGIGAPRNVVAALTLATAAAAGGDRAAASLMRRIENRYRARPEDADAYARLRTEASAGAMAFWVDGGLANAMR